MKRIIAVLCTVAMLCITLAGCDNTSVSAKESAYQTSVMQTLNDKVGNPSITNGFQKEMLKKVYEKCDDTSLVCFAYSLTLDGKYVFVGRCLGYGIPYSTQYTNPETPYWGYGEGGTSDSTRTSREYTIPQADPDGLYRPDGLTATWLMMINEETGESYIMYCEPTIVVTEIKMPKRLIADWSLPANYDTM